jgi:large subunit ribosomal protein L3
MNQSPGIIGKKVGFTQLFQDDGNVVRVTVVQAGPVTVLGKRTVEKDGYTALVLGLGDRKEKHTSKPLGGQFKKGTLAGANGAAKKIVQELRCDDAFAGKFEIGAVIKLDQVFEVGQKVDARGTTRGRGFSGVVRRWSFAGGVQTHGTHEYRRHGGSIGTNMTPGRTLPNIKMGGQYGNETVSILNLKVARIDVENNLLMIEGGIPGSTNSLVLVRHAVKVRKRRA